jgi:hypothetical protein
MGQMLRSPQLAPYVKSIERELEAERARFHEAVREDETAEFINGEVVVAGDRHDRVVRPGDSMLRSVAIVAAEGHAAILVRAELMRLDGGSAPT